jgi:hypothetical protein
VIPIPIVVGTTSGVYRIEEYTELVDTVPVAAVSDRFVLLDGNTVCQEDDPVPTAVHFDGPPAICLLWTGSELLAGTREAHLVRVGEGGGTPVASFDSAPGRETWHTPHGGPPSTRSLSAAGDGTLYANVHVGGILRSADAGASWAPTIDVDADVHQVLAVPGVPGMVLAASARGLEQSEDGGDSWTTIIAGLHATYARAVAASDEHMFLSVSRGPDGDQAAVYRRPLAARRRFERCRKGLPWSFSSNVDTACLSAAGDVVAFGVDGSVFVSVNGGEHWDEEVRGLPHITCVQVGPA